MFAKFSLFEGVVNTTQDRNVQWAYFSTKVELKLMSVIFRVFTTLESTILENTVGFGQADTSLSGQIQKKVSLSRQNGHF